MRMIQVTSSASAVQRDQSSQVLGMHLGRFSQNKRTHLYCLGTCLWCRVTASGSLTREDHADHRGDYEDQAKHPTQKQENEDGDDQEKNA
jgi:hypothetical protein